MLDLSPLSAFETLLHPLGDDVIVTDLDGIGIASVQALKGRSGDVLGALMSQFGLVGEDAPRRTVAGPYALIGTGPGKWLITHESSTNRLAAELASALGGIVAVNDQCDGLALIRLEGAGCYRLFAKGVNIDLHPAAFPVGATAATAIAHIGVTLWRCGDTASGAPVFEIALFRSMAGSFLHWLAASAKSG